MVTQRDFPSPSFLPDKKEEPEGEEGSSWNLEPAENRKVKPIGEGIREYEVVRLGVGGGGERRTRHGGDCSPMMTPTRLSLARRSKVLCSFRPYITEASLTCWLLCPPFLIPPVQSRPQFLQKEWLV